VMIVTLYTLFRHEKQNICDKYHNIAYRKQKK